MNAMEQNRTPYICRRSAADKIEQLDHDLHFEFEEDIFGVGLSSSARADISIADMQCKLDMTVWDDGEVSVRVKFPRDIEISDENQALVKRMNGILRCFHASFFEERNMSWDQIMPIGMRSPGLELYYRFACQDEKKYEILSTLMAELKSVELENMLKQLKHETFTAEATAPAEMPPEEREALEARLRAIKLQ